MTVRQPLAVVTVSTHSPIHRVRLSRQAFPFQPSTERSQMIQILELVVQIVTTIAYGVLFYVLWPLINAFVAAINGFIHVFVH